MVQRIAAGRPIAHVAAAIGVSHTTASGAYTHLTLPTKRIV